MVDEQAITTRKAQRLVGQRRQIRPLGLDHDLDRSAGDLAVAIKHGADRCRRGRGQAECSHGPAELGDRGFLGPALDRQRTAQAGVAEAGQELLPYLDQVARQLGMCACRQHGVIKRDADLDVARRAPDNAEHHRVRGHRMVSGAEWRLDAPVMDGIDDAIDVDDADAGQRLDQRRQANAVPEDHRDEHPLFLDSLVKQRRDLVADPTPLVGVRREHHQADVAAGESLVELGHDVVARTDLVGVIPGVDAACPQCVDEHLDRGLVERAVADEDLARPCGGAHHVHDLASSRGGGATLLRVGPAAP